MYSLIAVIFQDPPKIITDGIQGFVPTYPFKFTFTALADVASWDISTYQDDSSVGG
ncbi:hypothetical protein VEE48_40380 [Escherichia coli]|nr:hypothetical protein VEE48_40380 [Escherichia coli]